LENTKADGYEIFEKEFFPHIDALKTFAYHLCYDDGTNAKAWLFKILKNAYINEYRKKSKRPIKVGFEDFTTYHDSGDIAPPAYLDLRSELFDNMMGDEVTIAVNSLPIDFRTVLLLSDVEGFTYEEISKIVDVPIGTVRSRLFRARNMLKDKLKVYAEKRGFKDVRGAKNKKRLKSSEEE